MAPGRHGWGAECIGGERSERGLGVESTTDQGMSWRDSREFHHGASLQRVTVEKKNLTEPAACAGPAQHHLARPVHRGLVEKLLHPYPTCSFLTSEV
jgi:hypothetical protein